MALSVNFDFTLSVHNFTAGNMSCYLVTLDTERCNALAMIDMFIDTKLRDLMTLLVQNGQLDIIGTNPTICVPGVARITVHDFDFDNDNESPRNSEINCGGKPDVDLFIRALRDAFVHAYHQMYSDS